jgi:hypothetical protein
VKWPTPGPAPTASSSSATPTSGCPQLHHLRQGLRGMDAVDSSRPSTDHADRRKDVVIRR